jgi:general secretion pathway protein D
LNSASLDPAKIPGTGLNLIGTDSGNSVRALISALASRSKAKLLAAPHILVSDNREASIQVGQQVPIATSETFGTPGVAPQRTIQYKDIGIILKVKPQVNDSGLVSLEIKQEVSTYSTISLSVGQNDIILNKTEASTSLVVQDGHTIIIGGLIREDTTKTRSGIPWLSRIPVLGYLFGNTVDDESRTEIIILLTPHVIKNMNEAKALTTGFVDKFTEDGKGGVNKKELIKNSGDRAGE